MSKVQQLEAEIAQLPRAEFLDLARWFDSERSRQWDVQIEDDARNGKLRKLFERLQSEDQDQEEIPLNEVLDDPKLP